jgi:hypothetical protein
MRNRPAGSLGGCHAGEEAVAHRVRGAGVEPGERVTGQPGTGGRRPPEQPGWLPP